MLAAYADVSLAPHVELLVPSLAGAELVPLFALEVRSCVASGGRSSPGFVHFST